MSDKHIDEASGVATTGHEWDGIRELNNPMPRWWVWTFYATIVWALAYTIAYPAWPLIRTATTGLLGYSSRADLSGTSLRRPRRHESDYVGGHRLEERRRDSRRRQSARASRPRREPPPSRSTASNATGRARRARSAIPNLNDDDWLWGGSLEEIHRRSPTASASRPTPKRARPRCRRFGEISGAGADHRGHRISSHRSPARPARRTNRAPAGRCSPRTAPPAMATTARATASSAPPI